MSRIEREGIAAMIALRAMNYLLSGDTETDWRTVGQMLLDLSREIGRAPISASTPDEELRSAGYVLAPQGRYVDAAHGIDWAVILWCCPQDEQHRWAPGPGIDAPFCASNHPMQPVRMESTS